MFQSILFRKAKQTISSEKGQDVVEYSLLLAFFFGVAYFFYATGVFAYMRMFLLQAFYGVIHALEHI